MLKPFSGGSLEESLLSWEGRFWHAIFIIGKVLKLINKWSQLRVVHIHFLLQRGIVSLLGFYVIKWSIRDWMVRSHTWWFKTNVVLAMLFWNDVGRWILNTKFELRILFETARRNALIVVVKELWKVVFSWAWFDILVHLSKILVVIAHLWNGCLTVWLEKSRWAYCGKRIELHT
jgi:hypothetical protein